MSVRPWFVLGITGSSLSTGRLAADWVPQLLHDLQAQPEAVGPIAIYNMGHGSWTSADILANAPNITVLRPTHILAEGGAINDCFDGGAGPAISRADHIANDIAAITSWKTIPGVDITLQTMSSVSAGVAVGRPQLADYYADEIATAAAQGIGYIDHYAAWPKPLDPTKTNGAGPFALAPTATYGPMPDGTGWNPADKAATIQLSADLQQAYTAAVGWQGIRSAAAIAGKVHWELLRTPGNGVPGIANAAASLSAALGSDANSIAVYGNGSVDYNGVSVGNAGFTLATSGDVVAVEVDRPNNLIYFMKGAVRSAGFSIAGIAGPIYPAMVFGAAGGGVARFTPNGDGLHPLWTGAVDTYHYPSVLAWARAKMAAFWPA